MEFFKPSDGKNTSNIERFESGNGQNNWSDEKKLIKALAKGDEEAYRYLYRTYAPKIGALVKSFLGSDDIDDVIQEVFLRVYKGIKKFRGDSKLSTWIYKIAMNVCNNLYKKLKNNSILTDFEEGSSDEEYNEYHYQLSSEEDIKEEFSAEIVSRKIKEALDKLSPEDRALLYMKEVDGLTYAEIGKILDKPEGTIKSKLHYIKKQLKSFLGEALGDEQEEL
ncbi:RNA polymerase sigma factor [Fervidobacterium islandicum]|uniref:RNA polymerase sigma factor n=1 Tax=Fervidobacterium islandicum TaxID=2423 RepID=UPI000ABA2015